MNVSQYASTSFFTTNIQNRGAQRRALTDKSLASSSFLPVFEGKAKTIRFGQHPEISQIKVPVSQARDLLGQNVWMGIHASAFPVRSERDTGIGSPFSEDALDYTRYMRDLWGITHVQLGPMGQLSRGKSGGDLSPYLGTAFSRNPLLIDLFQLTTPEYGEILPQKIIDEKLVKAKLEDATVYEKEVVPKQVNFEVLTAPYGFLKSGYDSVLQHAYDGMMSSTHPNAQKLKSDFLAFENDEKVKYWLNSDALYEVLADHENQGEGNWRSWDNEDHKHLMWDLQSNNDKLKQKAILTKSGMEQKYQRELERFKFKQFIFHKQFQAFQKQMDTLGLKLVGDMPIAFSDRDVWAHRELFLEGNRKGEDSWRMGNENPYGSPERDGWNFPALNMERVFQPDGTMKPQASQFFTAVFDKFFSENKGGGRIDHVRGWISPWVYQGSPLKGRNLTDLFTLPQDAKLKGLMTRMLESAQKYGVQRIVVEDLGDTMPPSVGCSLNELKDIAGKQYGIVMGGMKPFRYYNPDEKEGHVYHPQNVGPMDQFFVTTHDGNSLLQLFNGLAGRFSRFLSGYLKGALPASEIGQSPAKFMEAMMATLFLRPQRNNDVKQEAFIYFQDLHGYGHQNNGALMFNDFVQPKNPNNWRMRINRNYKKEFEDRIQRHEIPSPPGVWKTALHGAGITQGETVTALKNLDMTFHSPSQTILRDL